jgi:hypothetical protein
MSSAPNSEDIARDARWLTQAVDPKAGIVRLVEMDREAYRQVSFLDDRMFQRPWNRLPVSWTVVEEAAGKITRNDGRWIFHISHVGSTLLARLLGEIPGVLSIREPRFLRDLVPIPAGERAKFAATAQRLFARTFAPDELALVKTTSFVSEMAPELVPAQGRALFLYVKPRNFLSSILAGPNSRRELYNRVEDREHRLLSREIALPPSRGDADLVAAAWAAEMTSLEVAADAMPDRHIGWMDFDEFLEDVQGGLATSVKVLGLAADSNRLTAIAQSPLIQRYSKAPQFEYSPALRREVIDGAIRRHGQEIDDALAMLDEAAEKSPLLARSLARCRGD